MTAAVQPTRGTRPRNRRRLILDAAATLFATRGYEHVNMSDVAAAVAVGPSALYRHFPKKEALLTEVVTSNAIGLGLALAALDEPGRTAETILAYSLDHREAGTLWEREARHLSPEAYVVVRGQMRAVADQLVDLLAQQFPDADLGHRRLAAAVMTTMSQSMAFHGVQLSRPAFDELLIGMIHRAIVATLTVDLTAADGPETAGSPPTSRTTQIIQAALRLFSTRTYASVSLEDIAAEVGIAPSGLYNHFASKADILASAQRRGSGYLQTSLVDTMALHADPRDCLIALVTDFAVFSHRHPFNTHTLITDQRNLAPEVRAQLARDQRDFQGEWVHLYLKLHPESAPVEALIAVQTITVALAFLAVNPLVRRARDGAGVLATIALAALDLNAE